MSLALGAAAVALCAALAGCSAPDRVAARLADGTVEFTFCDAQPADDLVVRHTTSERETIFWKADADHRVKFAAGSVITYGRTPEGFADSTSAVSLPEEGDFTVVLSLLASDGSVASAQYGTFQLSELSTEWRTAAGSTQSDPCDV